MEGGAPTRKRVRISIACQTCRTRKSRCDGQHPSCQRCLDIGAKCIYEQPGIQGVGEQTVSELLLRIEALEGKLHFFTDAPQIGDSPPHSEPTRNEAPQVSGLNFRDHDDVDGMGSIALSESAETSTFHGPSSNLALIRRISPALAYYSDHSGILSNEHKGISATGSSSAQRTRGQDRISQDMLNVPPSISSKLGSPLSLLPQHTEIMVALKEYFATVGSFFPCIDEETFFAAYSEHRKSEFKTARRSWLALLVMMICHANNTRTATSPSGQIEKRTENLFQIALAFAMPNLLFEANLEIVQLLCLTTCHLQSLPRSSQAWTFHSLAVKASMQVGFHTIESSTRLPLLDREMRKRTWLWCVVNDAMLSVTLGRPPLITKSLANLDVPQDISEINHSISHSASRTALPSSFFSSVIKLSRLTYDILSWMFENNQSLKDNRTVSQSLELSFRSSQALSEWLQSIPMELRPDPSLAHDQKQPSALLAQRFKTMLTFRYYGACILIQRPAILSFLEFQPGGSNSESDSLLLQNAGLYFLKSCVTTCEHCVVLAQTVVNEDRGEKVLLGAWWITSFYTFQASMMLVAVILIIQKPVFAKALDVEEQQGIWRSLEGSRNVLGYLDNNNLVISRCRGFLNALLETLSFLHGSNSSTGRGRMISGNEGSGLVVGQHNITDFEIGPHSVGDNLDFEAFARELLGSELELLNGT